MGLLTDKSG